MCLAGRRYRPRAPVYLAIPGGNAVPVYPVGGAPVVPTHDIIITPASEHTVQQVEVTSPPAPAHPPPKATTLPELHKPQPPAVTFPQQTEFEVPEQPQFVIPKQPEFEIPEQPKFEVPRRPSFETREPDFGIEESSRPAIPAVPSFDDEFFSGSGPFGGSMPPIPDLSSIFGADSDFGSARSDTRVGDASASGGELAKRRFGQSAPSLGTRTRPASLAEVDRVNRGFEPSTGGKSTDRNAHMYYTASKFRSL